MYILAGVDAERAALLYYTHTHSLRSVFGQTRMGELESKFFIIVHACLIKLSLDYI